MIVAPIRCLFKRFTILVSLLSLAAYAASCGTAHSPVASSDDRTALAPAAKKPGFRSRSTSIESVESVESVDLTADEVRSVTKWLKPNGMGSFHIGDTNSSYTTGDDLYVDFSVPRGATTERVLITMTVYGNYQSDLVIAFKPGGLEFVKDALLELDLGPDLVDVDTNEITVWHQYEDGTIEEFTVSATDDRSAYFTHFEIPVSGFSSYGLRGR